MSSFITFWLDLNLTNFNEGGRPEEYEKQILIKINKTVCMWKRIITLWPEIVLEIHDLFFFSNIEDPTKKREKLLPF